MTTIHDLLKEVYTSWDDAEALGKAGRELHDRTRLDVSRAALERALELDPTGSIENWEHLGFAYLRGFQSERGMETLRKGVEVTGSDAIRSMIIGFTSDEEEGARMKEEIGDSDDPVVQASMCWPRFHSGEAQEALETVKGLWEANPDDEDVRDNYLWMLLAAKNQDLEGIDLRETAFPLARQKIDEDPTRVSGHTMMIQLLNAEKDWDGVLAASEEALKHMPDEETIMQLRGRAYKEKEDHDHAIQWFSRAIGAKPSFAGARVDLGRLYETMDRLDLAEEAFREIPVANPDYPVGPMSLGLFFARHDRIDEAEEIFVANWPNLPDWFKGSLGHYPEAEAVMAREAMKRLVEPESREN